MRRLCVWAMRGYDVVAVVVPDGGGGYGNSDAIAKYARKVGVPTFVLPRIPGGVPPHLHSVLVHNQRATD